MWQFLIFQISSRPPPRKLSASKMASDCSILNLFTSFWILRQIYNTWFLNFFYVDVSLKLAITSQQILKIRNFWPIFYSQMQHFECCENALEASNLVKTCFLTSVLTWERLSFTFQTHNSNLLDPNFSTIFNIQKCNIFVVFSDSANASEKLDLVLFLWSARLVETYPNTSFIKNVSFWTLFSAPYTWGSTTKTSQSTTFFASSSKIEHFCSTNIDSPREPFFLRVTKP